MYEMRFDILSELYSRPIEDDSSGLLHGIQKVYQYRLKEMQAINGCLDAHFKQHPNAFGEILRFAPIPVIDGGFISLAQRPFPFYEECLELARYVNSLGIAYSSHPYYHHSDGTVYQNRSYRILTLRGEMPLINQENQERLRREIDDLVKRDVNMVYLIKGCVADEYNTEEQWVKSSILLSGCHVEGLKNHKKIKLNGAHS